MAHVRTQGDAFRRFLILRLPASVLMIALFVASLFSGSVPFIIVAFLLATLTVGMTVWFFVLYKRADPVKLGTAIDPNLRPTLRYPRPTKHPDGRPDEPS